MELIALVKEVVLLVLALLNLIQEMNELFRFRPDTNVEPVSDNNSTLPEPDKAQAEETIAKEAIEAPPPRLRPVNLPEGLDF